MAKATHKDRSEFLRAKSNWRSLKIWLSILSDKKCWYCEAKINRAPFDVDHFRPKLGITVDGDKLAEETGYYWLAYEWWNFRLSCQRCNRPESDDDGAVYGKANEFPLRDESKRCVDPISDLCEETPRLLDPCEQQDCNLLAYGVDGETKPNAKEGTWEFERASYTIKQLGLNAFQVPECKRTAWNELDTLIRLAGENPEVVAILKNKLSRGHEYSSFFRSAIGVHRDKQWVDALI
jgi:uncharacterized protein (TIGR02646 family)